MKMTFRWYGEKDCIPLSFIKQIQGVSGVVTAVYDTPVGEEWNIEDLLRLKSLAASVGLEAEVIESVPVHEDIKLGKPSRERYTEVYKHNIEVCAEAGVKCICYNFMPVFDWLRTDLGFLHADGSDSLRYDHAALTALDPGEMRLPGWDESYTPAELGALLAEYKGMTHDRLFENLVWFLREIIPVCERVGINMAIHPDDPPWDVFGLPRVVSREEDFDKLFAAVPCIRNGMTFCTGSLGAGRFNNLVHMAEKYAKRIHFAHIRQLCYDGDVDFYENGHQTACGNVDVFGVVRALVRNGFDGYVRPDHGRNVWGEKAKPGYGLYDRAMGACYLTGLFEAVEKEEK